ncbi:MAG: hypothetical protein QNJ49_11855 [Mastigocoleus sp. MO_167.B18]|nr:hypothetical protein [Mastigocoleus sp. MO_167.B18]
MRKTAFLTICFTFLVSLPAMARLGYIWTDFQNYAVDFQDYLTNNIDETVNPAGKGSFTAINNSTGALNLPNPIDVRQQVIQDITDNSLSDIFENNPAVQGKLIGNEIERQLTRAATESYFGAKGQERLQIKLETVQNLIENIDREADEARENNQNILNQLAGLSQAATGQSFLGRLISNQTNLQLQINRQQSRMIAESLGQNIKQNQYLQYSNLNLANISQQVEEANNARRVDSAASVARLLRASSQSDLFGREENE